MKGLFGSELFGPVMPAMTGSMKYGPNLAGGEVSKWKSQPRLRTSGTEAGVTSSSRLSALTASRTACC